VKEIIDYIEELPKFTKKHSSEYLLEFLRFLGNPEQGKKVIHVAGTNGKGTVCSYLKSMLLAVGKKVGCFTSPHLIHLHERININGQDISDTKLRECFVYVKTAVGKMEEAGLSHPSYFEFLFGMALVAFHEHRVTYLILETGLGGRLDATNIIAMPLLTIITSIGLDHQEILGNTIEEIAREKAGIIKEGVPLVHDAKNKTATRVIQDIAKEKKSNCFAVSDKTYEICEMTDTGIAFLMRDSYYEKAMWNTKGQGIWQITNAGLALEGMRALQEMGEVPKALNVWKQALQESFWQGRMQQIETGLFIDGAHNHLAMQEFVKSVRLQKVEKIVIIFAIMQDKHYENMIQYLCTSLEVEQVIVTTLQDTRSVTAEKLQSVFETYTDAPVCKTNNIQEAWQILHEMDRTKKTTYCLGSLYFVGEILKLWRETQNVKF